MWDCYIKINVKRNVFMKNTSKTERCQKRAKKGKITNETKNNTHILLVHRRWVRNQKKNYCLLVWPIDCEIVPFIYIAISFGFWYFIILFGRWYDNSMRQKNEASTNVWLKMRGIWFDKMESRLIAISIERWICFF